MFVEVINLKGDNQVNRHVEIKISADGGETWFRRKINFGHELDESGLRPGEIFEYQGGQYEIKMGDEGLKVDKLEKRVGRTKTVNCLNK